ncbi:MAG TPA: hypothetical protein VH877_28315 [Polyangia bacterium]|jgi:hypothetical protein|nr:hypothetical protein [Polyangia bacterium]
MVTLRTVLCLSFLGLGGGLGLGACYRPGDLGDTPYLCTSARPACPDGYVCAVSLGTCVRKSASSRRASAAAPAGPAATAGAAAPTGAAATARVGGPAEVAKDDAPGGEVEPLDDGPAEEGESEDSEVETAAAPRDRSR